MNGVLEEALRINGMADVLDHEDAADRSRMRTAFLGLPGIDLHVRAPGLPGEPTAEEMARKLEAVRFSKTPICTAVRTATFDLYQPDQARRFCEVYGEILAMQAKGTVVVVTSREDHHMTAAGPVYLRHLVWLEYQLEVTDHSTNETTRQY